VLPKLKQLKALADKYNINTFYLFGSYSEGDMTKSSDIDLAYLSEVGKETVDRDTLYFDFKQYTSQEVDLIDLRRASLSFAFQIIKDGRIIFDREPEPRTDFEDELVKKYLDFSTYIRRNRNEIAGNFNLEVV